jgi:hypothetical protein
MHGFEAILVDERKIPGTFKLIWLIAPRNFVLHANVSKQ